MNVARKYVIPTALAVLTIVDWEAAGRTIAYVEDRWTEQLDDLDL